MPIAQLQAETARALGIYTWATKPSAAGNEGLEIIVSDLDREVYRSNNISWVPVSRGHQRRTARALLMAYEASRDVRKNGSPGRPVSALTPSADIPAISTISTDPSADADPATAVVYMFGGKAPNNWGTTPLTVADLSQDYVAGNNPSIPLATVGQSLLSRVRYTLYNSADGGGTATNSLGEVWGVSSGGAKLSFTYTGDVIYYHVHSGQHAIYVNGALVTPSSIGGEITVGALPFLPISPNGGRWIKLKFPSAAPRKIEIALAAYAPAMIKYQAKYQLIGTAPKLRAAFFGTSFTAGATSDSAVTWDGDRFVEIFGRMLNGEIEIFNCGIGSSSLASQAVSTASGSILPGGARYTGRPASHRLALQISTAGLDLDLIVLFMGHNDNGAHAGPVFSSEMQAFWQDAREMHPRAILVLAGPDASVGTISGGLSLAMGQKMQQLAQQHGVIFIPTQTMSPPFWSGTGKQGSENGSGTTDILTGPDGTHPTIDGHYAIGRHLASSLVSHLSTTKYP